MENLEKKYAETTFHTEGSIFHQTWFLDAVCGEGNWAVCLDEDKNGLVQGVLIYHTARQWGFPIIKQPTLTPFMPLYLHDEAHWKNTFRLSFQKKTLRRLFSQIPPTAHFLQFYPPYFKNWLPLKWLGFRIEPMMLYAIQPLQDTDRLWSNLKDTVRNKIRKAEKSGIEVVLSDDFDGFYKLFTATFSRLKAKTGATENILRRLDTEIRKRQVGQIYLARQINTADSIAALYVVWDKTTAYYWVAATGDTTQNEGATSLLLWSVLKDLGQRGIKRFEATGSMAENLETFIAAFGAEQEVFWKVSRYGNRFWAVLHSLRGILRGG
jgi:hypothetical protein